MARIPRTRAGGGPTAALAAALLFVSALVPTTARSAERAQGFVFVDQDGDGVRDPGEAGLQGVAVSDGRRVVRTDAEGRWSLPVRGPAVFFVSKPAGYALPLDEQRQPRSYSIHRPAPTGKEHRLRFPGPAPTGPLPASIDFALTPRAEPADFDVLLLADPQTKTSAELDFLRDDIVSELMGVPAAFGVTLGDIVYDDLALLPRYEDLMSAVGVPWHNVPGNHELNVLADGRAHSREAFVRHFGPPWYSFDYGEAHFIVLDTVHYKGNHPPRTPPHPRGFGDFEGRLGADQLEWLRQDLGAVPKERLVVLFMHIPFRSTMRPGAPHYLVADRKPLMRLLSGRPNLLALAGHVHASEHVYMDRSDGFTGPGELHVHVLPAASGSWWGGAPAGDGVPCADGWDGSPNGWGLLSVRGSKATVRFRAARKPASHTMRIRVDSVYHGYGTWTTQYNHRWGELLDTRIERDALPSARLLVNLFDGGPRTTVQVRFDDRPPVPMARTPEVDPYIQELRLRSGQSWTEWVKPQVVEHMWSLPLPTDLKPGPHRVTVTAEDDYGLEHTGHAVLEVEARR